MKKDFKAKALEIIGNFAITSTDLLEAMLKAGYGASAGRIEYEFNKLQRERFAANFKEINDKKIKHRFYSMMYKLKKQQLVAEKESLGGRKLFQLTSKGNDALKKKQEKFPPPFYKKTEDAKFTIVIFDIPEKERRKRNWLREALYNAGFDLLQKSVFAGKVKVPEELINDMNRLKILDFVEIFEITKTGSLKHVV